MNGFRILLFALVAVIAIFTLLAVLNDGLDLVTPFLTPIFARTWQGQFNVDFSLYLVLSGVWMAWRGGFTGGSITLGVLAPMLGMLFLAPYLIYLCGRSGNDPRKLLLGVHVEG